MNHVLQGSINLEMSPPQNCPPLQDTEGIGPPLQGPPSLQLESIWRAFLHIRFLLECSSMILEPLKHALELKKKNLIFFGFCPKELNFYGLELKVQEVKFRVLNSFQ